MKEYKEAITDIESGEVFLIDFNESELAIHEELKQKAEQKISELQLNNELKETAKQAAKEKLAALGLTAEEIAAITGA